MSFLALGLEPALVKAVESKGYTIPTPIQVKAIPAILQGRDILAGAQTGTGKTAAFALPLLQNLNRVSRKDNRPRALVLTPTRELAAQVGESFSVYGKNLSLKSTVIFGGVGITPQIDKLRRGVDILVATPGRLLDHASQKTVDLSAVEVLILDEADRMLDMGFIHDIKRVLKLLPQKRQNLLFSATYSEDIRRLAGGMLQNPELIEVAKKNATADNVEHSMYRVGAKVKREVLAELVRDGDWRRVLVFTRTKHGANRLAEYLGKGGITAAAIHGNKSQTARTKALAEFKDGSTRVLVATDIASRGLDISGLPHVVNYELPNVAEDYVHRIGRTGRAGASGEAVSLVCREEEPLLRAIEKVLGRSIPVVGTRRDDDESAESRALAAQIEPMLQERRRNNIAGNGSSRGSSRGPARGPRTESAPGAGNTACGNAVRQAQPRTNSGSGGRTPQKGQVGRAFQNSRPGGQRSESPRPHRARG